ncbi:hypothetical protein H2200_010192 [Cladophialophora chaetospira]|uniref:Uncharacterized protein n=1 Tax=Cladophialophora chaetospira TaxID=386627 RepID=A0AA38X2E6_9EURO|nr:hypothetical protein H2200_010192 [Cladophialophora chaetospira]
MEGGTFSEQLAAYHLPVFDDFQYSQGILPPAFGTPHLPVVLPMMNANDQHPDMFSAMRLAHGTPNTNQSVGQPIDGYRSGAGFEADRYTNTQFGQELPYHHGQDPFLTANFAEDSLQEADPYLDTAEDEQLFEEEYAVGDPSDGTEDGFDPTADPVVIPKDIVQRYDGRSPQFAPYHVPIHGNIAQAILPVHFAKVPKFSLLVMNPRNKLKIMKEFPPPWIPIPDNLTLFDILQGWLNHLRYEGLDCFIQIGTAAPNLTEHMTPKTLKLLREYRICTAKPGKNENNWLQKRLDNRKEDLGQAYIDALEQAPPLRTPGAIFGSDSKNKARVRGSGKSRKSATAAAPVTQTSAPGGSQRQRKQRVTHNAGPQSLPAVNVAASNDTGLTTKATAPVTSATGKTALKPRELAAKPSTVSSTTKMPSMAVPITKLSKELHPVRRSATMMPSAPEPYTPSPSSRRCAIQQPSAIPSTLPASLPNVVAPFNLPSNRPLLSFFVKNISAQSTRDKPRGSFLDMDFWDSSEQYGTVKKEFADRTHQCMKLAGKLIATDPTLITASVPLQLESTVILIGQDIFSRRAELLESYAAFLEKAGKMSKASALQYAFSNAFAQVMHLCLSDALEEAVYTGLLNAFGPNSYQNPALFDYHLLSDVRSAAVTFVTQTQDGLYGQLQQCLQSQQANPTGFKVRRLLQTALSASSGTISSAMRELLSKATEINGALNSVNAPGGQFRRGTNMSLARDNACQGLPQVGSAGLTNRMMSTARNTNQTLPLFAVAPANGVKRVRNSKDADDVFYDGDPDELTPKRFKPTVSNATRAQQPSLYQENAFSIGQNVSTNGVDQATLTVSDDGVAAVNFNANAGLNPVAPSSALPQSNLYRSNVDALRALEAQAGYGYTQDWPTSPILFQEDIPTIADDENAKFVEQLEAHYRGGAPEPWNAW